MALTSTTHHWLAIQAAALNKPSVRSDSSSSLRPAFLNLDADMGAQSTSKYFACG